MNENLRLLDEKGQGVEYCIANAIYIARRVYERHVLDAEVSPHGLAVEQPNEDRPTTSELNPVVPSVQPQPSASSFQDRTYARMAMEAETRIEYSASSLREQAEASSDRWFAAKVRRDSEFIERKARRLVSIVSSMASECDRGAGSERFASLLVDAQGAAETVLAVSLDLLDASNETSDLKLALRVARSVEVFIQEVSSMNESTMVIALLPCPNQ